MHRHTHAADAGPVEAVIAQQAKAATNARGSTQRTIVLASITEPFPHTRVEATTEYFCGQQQDYLLNTRQHTFIGEVLRVRRFVRWSEAKEVPRYDFGVGLFVLPRAKAGGARMRRLPVLKPRARTPQTCRQRSAGARCRSTATVPHSAPDRTPNPSPTHPCSPG